MARKVLDILLTLSVWHVGQIPPVCAYNPEDCMWQARIETANGVFELAKPDGTTGYARLERLLSLFAGVGICRSTIEWENFPAFYLDRVN